MVHNPGAKVRVSNNDDVILHFFGQHAATFQWIVALQSLHQENRNYNPEQHTLAPEGVKIPKGTTMLTEIDRVQERLFERHMRPVVEGEGAQGEPEDNEDETPAALPQK